MSGEQKTLAIVGLGLIGASIAEATRKHYPGWKIIGFSSPNTIKEAFANDLIDAGGGYGSIRKALLQADLVFLCTPIDHILGLLKQWISEPPRLKAGIVISDVGSTKATVCSLGKKAFPLITDGLFIGSHPMAGSEKTGIKARDAHLFEAATWIICPNDLKNEKTKKSTLFLKAYFEKLGARTLLMDSKDHDRYVTLASHIPQLLSTSLAAFVARADSDEVVSVLEVAGGGFRDMTRLAASSFTVWEPIIRTNRKNLEGALSKFREQIGIMQRSLSKDGGRQFFTDANMLRGRFNAPRKGFSSPTTEILIDLEDKPGALLAAITPLSKAGVNILDLEILKVREGEEGTLMMGFRKPEEAQTALDLLAKSGHKARLR